MLRIVESLNRFSNLKSEISNLIGQATGISKQLHGWIGSLKDSDIKGVRYYNSKTKAKIEQDKEFEEFDRQMSQFRREHEERLKREEMERARERGEI